VKNSSIYRIFFIVRMMVKFFVQVSLFQRKYRQPWGPVEQRKWETLLVKQAIEYRETALDLEGLLIKLGQFLSTRADILPDVFLQELGNLVDQVPPVPWSKVEEILKADWGSYDSKVKHISPEAVASASIGVVYHAQLQSGQEVAIKVRRPGIDFIIRSDFRAIRIVIWLAERFTTLGKKVDLPALYREMVDVISGELNFRQELQNGLYFQGKYEHTEGVYIPHFYSEHSTPRILVMEWIEGAKITDMDFLEKHQLNRSELSARLFRCFAQQLFFGGKFHADPHPGNLLIRPDGTIVLIDFGMVATLTKDDARAIQALVEGVVVEDTKKVIESLESLRFLLPSADKRALEAIILDIIRFYTRSERGVFDEAVLDKIVQDVQAVVKREPIQLPSEFAFFGRALSTLIGVLHVLDPGVDLAALAKPVVQEWLASRDGEETTANASTMASAWRLAREYAMPLLRYPQLIEELLEAPRRNYEWDREKFTHTLVHQYYVRQKLYAFVLFITSLMVTVIGQVHAYASITIIAAGLGVVAALYYLICSRRHYRLIRSLQGRRRN